jgi:cytochrome c oxidase assembly protein Cox11
MKGIETVTLNYTFFSKITLFRLPSIEAYRLLTQSRSKIRQ